MKFDMFSFIYIFENNPVIYVNSSGQRRGDITLILSRGRDPGRRLLHHIRAPARRQKRVIIMLRQPFSPVGEESGGDEQTWRQWKGL